MLSPGAIVFVNFPEESKQRVLHAARVAQNNSNGLVLRLDEPGLPVEPERGFRLYYEQNLKFVQQAAKIEAVLGAGEVPAGTTPPPTPPASTPAEAPQGPTIIVRTLGEPVSAEGRECYRVSTLLSGLKAGLGDVADGALADVSVTGFSIISHATHEAGTVLPVTLHHEGKTFAGQGAIQSIKALADGRIRYGLLCADNGRLRSPLKTALQQISVAVQRQQLKRLAGAAA